MSEDGTPAKLERADAVADNFRSLIALIISAALGAESFKSQNGISYIGAMLAGALFFLGLSWLTQKAKAQARGDNPNLDNDKLGFFLKNWVHDSAAYSLLLGAGVSIAANEVPCKWLLSLGVTVLFFAMVCLVRWSVSRWEKGEDVFLFVKK